MRRPCCRTTSRSRNSRCRRQEEGGDEIERQQRLRQIDWAPAIAAAGRHRNVSAAYGGFARELLADTLHEPPFPPTDAGEDLLEITPGASGGRGQGSAGRGRLRRGAGGDAAAASAQSALRAVSSKARAAAAALGARAARRG